MLKTVGQRKLHPITDELKRFCESYQKVVGGKTWLLAGGAHVHKIGSIQLSTNLPDLNDSFKRDYTY